MKSLKILTLTIASFNASFTASLAQAKAVGFHGMVLFGQKHTYVSHLPMLHHPHNQQLVLKVDIDNLAQQDTLAIYEQIKDDGESLFTIAPEILDLDALAAMELQHFKATLYAGHFEKGGVALGSLSITPTEVIYTKKINPAPDLSNDYLVFGNSGEFYAIHEIAGKGDFDAILHVEAPVVKVCLTRTCVVPELGSHEFEGSFGLRGKGFQDMTIFPAIGDYLSSFSHRSQVYDIIYLETADLE